MVKVALRFGCAKQSKNIEWFLQCMYQRKNHTIKQANEKVGNIELKFVQMKPKLTLILIDLYLQGGGGGSRIRLLRMFAPEQIRMLGPTTEPLYIVVRMINIIFIG